MRNKNIDFDRVNKILDAIQNSVLSDGEIYEQYGKDASRIAMDWRQEIIGLISGGGESRLRGDWSCIDEVVYRLLVLSQDDAGSYAKLFSGLTGNASDSDINTLSGMFLLSGTVHSILDDHDFVIDSSGGYPCITRQDDAPEFLPLVRPPELLKKLVDIMGESPGNHASQRPEVDLGRGL